MAEKIKSGLTLETEDAAERALWEALGDVHAPAPSTQLRQGFYRKLARAQEPTIIHRLYELLGLSGNAGWATAAACLLVGLGTGLLLSSDGYGNGDADRRLVALEQNITLLNRRLILDRMEDQAPSKRLRGIIDAAYVAGNDAEVARALLIRATRDRVGSVRSAAIDALGASIDTPAVSEQLMPLLQQAGSPIVQLALVDLILRYGNDEQIGEVRKLVRDNKLHPDLQRYVVNSLQGDAA